MVAASEEVDGGNARIAQGRREAIRVERRAHRPTSVRGMEVEVDLPERDVFGDPSMSVPLHRPCTDPKSPSPRSARGGAGRARSTIAVSLSSCPRRPHRRPQT